MSLHAKRWGELPAELLHRIFSLKEPGGGPLFDRSEVISLKDRLCCQAVCRAWRHALASSSLPLVCVLDDDDPSWLKMAEWVCRTQPTVHTMEIACDELSIVQDTDAQTVLCALLSVQPRTALQRLAINIPSPVFRCLRTVALLFHQLMELDLSLDDGQPWPLDASWLQGVPNLQFLRVWHWDRVSITADVALLSQLTALELHSVNDLELDAALPALQKLSFVEGGAMRLCGERLRLPALTYLELSGEAELRFSAMPALQKLELNQVQRIAATELQEFSTLTHLTVLNAQWLSAEVAAAVAGWLAWAPPSLCTLYVSGEAMGILLSGEAASLDSITSMQVVKANEIRHLTRLRRLQQLQVVFDTPADLGLEDLQCLVGLTSLRLLRFQSSRVSEQEVNWRQMQLLRRALPEACSGVQLPVTN